MRHITATLVPYSNILHFPCTGLLMYKWLNTYLAHSFKNQKPLLSSSPLSSFIINGNSRLDRFWRPNEQQQQQQQHQLSYPRANIIRSLTRQVYTFRLILLLSHSRECVLHDDKQTISTAKEIESCIILVHFNHKKAEQDILLLEHLDSNSLSLLTRKR
jgi:hypothetical protein